MAERGMGRRRTSAVLVTLVAFALAGAGCGGSSSKNSAKTTSTTATTAASTTVAPTTTSTTRVKATSTTAKATSTTVRATTTTKAAGGYVPTQAVKTSPTAAKQVACQYWSLLAPKLINAASTHQNVVLVQSTSASVPSSPYQSAVSAAAFANPPLKNDLPQVGVTVGRGAGTPASFIADQSAIAKVTGDCT